MKARSGIEVRSVSDRPTLKDWLDVPAFVMAGDPFWVPPLRFVERQRISPKHNPFFAYGDAVFFVAYRDGMPVGRISAQVNRCHLELHGDGAGHFGFFDCANDPDAAAALVETAASWLRRHGLTRMLGPFNLTINQEAGLLVSGFDCKPAIMTPHTARWSGALLEGCGLVKEMDLLAYRMAPAAAPPQIERLARLARTSGRVRVRNLDMRRYMAETQLIFDIFDDAWSDNWGFVPFTHEERPVVARDLRPFMRSKFGVIVEIDGEPMAMAVALPDINEVITPYRGRMLPFNWAKLAYAVLRNDWRTARVPLLGIRKKYRNSPLAAGVLSMMIGDLLELGRQYRLDWVEFSWVLETNRAMVALAELAAGKAVKVFRVYGKEIAPNNDRSAQAATVSPAG